MICTVRGNGTGSSKSNVLYCYEMQNVLQEILCSRVHLHVHLVIHIIFLYLTFLSLFFALSFSLEWGSVSVMVADSLRQSLEYTPWHSVIQPNCSWWEQQPYQHAASQSEAITKLMFAVCVLYCYTYNTPAHSTPLHTYNVHVHDSSRLSLIYMYM